MSMETTSFLSQLAKTRSRQETALMRRRVEQGWRMRCADGDTPPVHEVEGDHRYDGLVP